MVIYLQTIDFLAGPTHFVSILVLIPILSAVCRCKPFNTRSFSIFRLSVLRGTAYQDLVIKLVVIVAANRFEEIIVCCLTVEEFIIRVPLDRLVPPSANDDLRIQINHWPVATSDSSPTSTTCWGPRMLPVGLPRILELSVWIKASSFQSTLSIRQKLFILPNGILNERVNNVTCNTSLSCSVDLM